MSRMFGTVVRGVRAPIFREGDDVVKGTVDTVLKALKENSVEPHDKDEKVYCFTVFIGMASVICCRFSFAGNRRSRCGK